MGLLTKMIEKGDCRVYPVIVPVNYSLRTINFYLIEESGSLTLIDAGFNNDECWEFLIRVLNENRFSLSADIKQIILTHSHQDHTGLVNRIVGKKEIPIYAHFDSVKRLKRDKDFMKLRIDFFNRFYQEMGCGVAGRRRVQRLKELLKKNKHDEIKADIIPIANSEMVNGMEVMETPGHAPDHLVLFDTKRKWLFAGDHLIRHISSNAIVEPDGKGNRIFTLVQYIASLKKCLTLDAEVVFPGHGNCITNHRDLIKLRLKHIDEKAAKIRNLIKKDVSTANQLALTYYPNQYESEFSLVISEIVGHLDYLEVEGKIEKQKKDGIWHYYIK